MLGKTLSIFSSRHQQDNSLGKKVIDISMSRLPFNETCMDCGFFMQQAAVLLQKTL